MATLSREALRERVKAALCEHIRCLSTSEHKLNINSYSARFGPRRSNQTHLRQDTYEASSPGATLSMSNVARAAVKVTPRQCSNVTD